MTGRYQQRISFGGALTPSVKILIIINVCAFFLLNLAKNSSQIILFLGLVPDSLIQERFLWQPVTYMFLHVDFWHIVWNMLALWWFGCDIERNFGKKYFFRYYFLTGIGAGLFAVAFSWGSKIPIIGASGAIFGILLAFGILFANRKIYVMFVLPMKAKWVVLIFAVIQIFLMFGAKGSKISHSAHVGGLIVGLIWFGYYLKYLRLSTIRGLLSKSKTKKPPLYVVKDDENIDDFFDDDNSTVH